MEQEQTFDESIATVVRALPAPIREFITNGSARRVVLEIKKKYDMHIDQAAIVEQEVLLLLIGVNAPDAFIHALKNDARLDEKTITGIVQDVNERIFIPLRKAEEKQGMGALLQTPVTKAPQASAPPVPSKVTAPSVSVLPPKQLMPSAPVSNVPPPQKTPLPPRGMAPEIAPENLPGAMPPPESTFAKSSQSVPSQAPPPAPAAPRPASLETPITKSYAVDPYREQILDDLES